MKCDRKNTFIKIKMEIYRIVKLTVCNKFMRKSIVIYEMNN